MGESERPGVIGELCQEIVKQFGLKFDWLPSSKECHLATLFDPCYKDYVTKKCGDFKATQVRNWAIDETMKKMAPIEHDQESGSSQSKKSGKNRLWENHDRNLTENLSCVNSNEEIVNLELQHYLALKDLPRGSDPIKWWFNIGKLSFPNLFQAAKKFLIIQASSIPSGKIFLLFIFGKKTVKIYKFYKLFIFQNVFLVQLVMSITRKETVLVKSAHIKSSVCMEMQKTKN